MDAVDRKVSAALEGQGAWSDEAAGKLEKRLADELLPAETSPRAQRRTLLACTGCALVAGVLATSIVELQRPSPAPARWPSAAFDASPSVLLAGR